MKIKKVLIALSALCLLMVFIGLSGCKQEVQPITTPSNSGSGGQHYLTYLGGNRVLDWDGREYRIWVYDPSARGSADPLPGGPEVEGMWSSLNSSHNLIYMGSDRVLDWNWRTGDYRIWVYNRAARGNTDPFTGPEVWGKWSSIAAGNTADDHDVNLVYLGDNRLLEWHDNDGKWWVWVYDRSIRGNNDPIPNKEAYGQWKTINDDGNHLLWYIGEDTTNRQVLEVDQSHEFWVWNYDASLRGQTDVLTPRLNKGKWGTLMSYDNNKGYDYIYLGNNRLLVFEYVSGWYGIYAINRNAANGQDPIPGDPEVSGTWSSMAQ